MSCNENDHNRPVVFKQDIIGRYIGTCNAAVEYKLNPEACEMVEILYDYSTGTTTEAGENVKILLWTLFILAISAMGWWTFAWPCLASRPDSAAFHGWAVATLLAFLGSLAGLLVVRTRGFKQIEGPKQEGLEAED